MKHLALPTWIYLSNYLKTSSAASLMFLEKTQNVLISSLQFYGRRRASDLNTQQYMKKEEKNKVSVQKNKNYNKKCEVSKHMYIVFVMQWQCYPFFFCQKQAFFTILWQNVIIGTSPLLLFLVLCVVTVFFVVWCAKIALLYFALKAKEHISRNFCLYPILFSSNPIYISAVQKNHTSGSKIILRHTPYGWLQEVYRYKWYIVYYL